MNTPTPPLSALGRAIRTSLMATSATLAMGLALSLLLGGPAALVGEKLVWLGLAMLIAIPVANVVDVLIIEWRLKEWPFVGAAIGVLLLLAYAIISKLTR
jgi:uncharacterized membrane protein